MKVSVAICYLTIVVLCWIMVCNNDFYYTHHNEWADLNVYLLSLDSSYLTQLIVYYYYVIKIPMIVTLDLIKPIYSSY